MKKFICLLWVEGVVLGFCGLIYEQYECYYYLGFIAEPEAGMCLKIYLAQNGFALSGL